MEMRLLELFCGTKSVGNCFVEQGWEVVSVDSLSKWNPTIIADIRQLPITIGQGFDMIWASPPCTEFSLANSTGTRDLQTARAIVQHTLAIINRSGCRWWVMENPASGLLGDQDFMQGIPYKDVSYCMYSDWGYRKQTRLWGNVHWSPKTCNKDCGNMIGKRHRCTAQKARSYPTDQDFKSIDLYRIPPKLIEELLSHL